MENEEIAKKEIKSANVSDVCICMSREKNTAMRCILCPSSEGVLKPTSKGDWCHTVCALYVPGAKFSSRWMRQILVDDVAKTLFNKVCYICKKSNRPECATVGACVPCAISTCEVTFHATCGLIQGLLFECDKENTLTLSKTYSAYCSEHKRGVKRRRFTIPEIKAIEHKDPIKRRKHSRDSSILGESNLIIKSSVRGNDTLSEQFKIPDEKFGQGTTQKDGNTNLKVEDGQPEGTPCLSIERVPLFDTLSEIQPLIAHATIATETNIPIYPNPGLKEDDVQNVPENVTDSIALSSSILNLENSLSNSFPAKEVLNDVSVVGCDLRMEDRPLGSRQVISNEILRLFDTSLEIMPEEIDLLNLLKNKMIVKLSEKLDQSSSSVSEVKIETSTTIVSPENTEVEGRQVEATPFILTVSSPLCDTFSGPQQIIEPVQLLPERNIKSDPDTVVKEDVENESKDLDDIRLSPMKEELLNTEMGNLPCEGSQILSSASNPPLEIELNIKDIALSTEMDTLSALKENNIVNECDILSQTPLAASKEDAGNNSMNGLLTKKMVLDIEKDSDTAEGSEVMPIVTISPSVAETMIADIQTATEVGDAVDPNCETKELYFNNEPEKLEQISMTPSNSDAALTSPKDTSEINKLQNTETEDMLNNGLQIITLDMKDFSDLIFENPRICEDTQMPTKINITCDPSPVATELNDDYQSENLNQKWCITSNLNVTLTPMKDTSEIQRLLNEERSSKNENEPIKSIIKLVKVKKSGRGSNAEKTGKKHRGGRKRAIPPIPKSVLEYMKTISSPNSGIINSDNGISTESSTKPSATKFKTMEDLLEWQWNETGALLTNQVETNDVASLLSCLHDLKRGNEELLLKYQKLLRRRDHLRTMNTKLQCQLLSQPVSHAGNATQIVPDSGQPCPSVIEPTSQTNKRQYKPHQRRSKFDYIQYVTNNVDNPTSYDPRTPMWSQTQTQQVLPSFDQALNKQARSLIPPFRGLSPIGSQTQTTGFGQMPSQSAQNHPGNNARNQMNSNIICQGRATSLVNSFQNRPANKDLIIPSSNGLGLLYQAVQHTQQQTMYQPQTLNAQDLFHQANAAISTQSRNMMSSPFIAMNPENAPK